MGRLSRTQQEVVTEHVRGQTVHDFGAGDLRLSLELLALGAREVFAVDHRVPRQLPNGATDRLYVVQERFEDYTLTSPVAFVSWPVNWPVGLHVLLEATPTVIYLGKNMDGTVCGYPALWQQLVVREVLAHVPEQPNTLIVYGPRRLQREQLPEERAALDPARVWYFEEVFPNEASTSVEVGLVHHSE